MTNQDKNDTNQNETVQTGNEEKTLEKSITQAHDEAEKDIENDPDLQTDPTDDLDEGELARSDGED